MRFVHRLAVLCCLLVPARAGADAPPRGPQGPRGDNRLGGLVDAFYRDYPRFYPSHATDLGLHERDQELEDISPAGIARELEWLRRFDAQLAPLRPESLPAQAGLDLRLLRLRIAARLLELQELRPLQRRPNAALRIASFGVYGLIKRDFAPAAQRMAAVVARERRIPALLAAARAHLLGPDAKVAAVGVDIALRDLKGLRGFLADDVPRAFESLPDTSALKSSTAAAVRALDEYAGFLKGELAPRATAPFAVGEALFVKLLRTDEMIDEPLDALLARGEAELARLQRGFRDTARRINPALPPEQVQLAMQKDHPRAQEVIATVTGRLTEMQRFLRERGIVTVPSEVLPQVKETPPFLRATTLASMETPGPFETRSTDAYYNVTLPGPDWSAARTEDFLRGAYNRPLIDIVTIHEAYPGHYVQFLWAPRLSKVRKYEGVASNSEGWAHYTEQMMLDEGFGKGDARLRLGQLQDALLRAARYVVAIRMHTRGMSVEQAAQFFVKDGYQTQEVAALEARRGTQDPLYLYYTWGKLEILRLREDFAKKLGAGYTLRKFHDAVLAQGRLPLPLLREALLRD